MYRCRTAVTVVFVGLLAVALLPGTAAASGSAKHSTTSRTAYFAEAPSSPPNDIFPLVPPGYLTTANIQQFQQLMYRPLYWMGSGNTPELSQSLSLAQPPVYGPGNTVTINLKPYRWSDGESVTAEDVMFWMNLLHAAKTDWAGYIPGDFPDNVFDVVVDSPSQLTFDLTASYDPEWFTYNELSQITPLPLAWDKTSSGGAPGSGGCSSASYGSADLACDGVYGYLSQSAGVGPTSSPATANPLVVTYGANALWGVVDGPWRVKSLTTSGLVTMVSNRSYSGPRRTDFTTFVERPYSSGSAEQKAVSSGRLDVGYLPFGDVSKVTAKPLRPARRTKLPTGYSLVPLYTWAIDYIPYNFFSTDDRGVAGKIFSQPYFRQALQMLVDQPAEIRKVFKGYGIPTVGPIPLEPPSAFAAGIGTANPYPYDPSRAVSLLEQNGWHIQPNGISTCTDPGSGSGQCGAGIPAGAGLDFSLEYTVGTSEAALLAVQEPDWARAGIEMTTDAATPDVVAADSSPCQGGASCTWDFEWGPGWSFYPDVYPSGEEILTTGSGENFGSFSSASVNSDIARTEGSATALPSYFEDVAHQLPVLFEPVGAASLTEIRGGLLGVTPQNVLGALTPESWHWAHPKRS
jgi:peptide/nickel transport system substrate-binding protein